MAELKKTNPQIPTKLLQEQLLYNKILDIICSLLVFCKTRFSVFTTIKELCQILLTDANPMKANE